MRARFLAAQARRWRLSLFEKVILANSLMLVGEALAGLWVTSHNVEAHHYLIDTSFIVLAALLSISINILLLRASFRPLFSLLQTIRAVSAGETEKRASIIASDSEIGELAHTFNTMLDRLEKMRREQAMLILQAQEEEQRRLALELHDESSQNLTALLVHTEVLKQSLQALPDTVITIEAREQLAEKLAYIAQLTQSTLDNIRTLAQQLRPAVLDDLGLQAAFRWLAEDGRQRLQLAVELQAGEVEKTLHTYLDNGAIDAKQLALYETALFRIAQESLTNIARHAHAQHVSISLLPEPQYIRLRVQDDGCGYEPSQAQTGLGVFGMRERAALLGGTISITSQPGQGTTVETLLPLPAKKEGERA